MGTALSACAPRDGIGGSRQHSRYPNVQPLAVLALVDLFALVPTEQRRFKHARAEEPVNPPRVATLRGELVVHAYEDRP